MSGANLYDLLGVEPTATQDEIRSAFRRLARQLHPDREGGDADRMAAVNQAYEALSDPEARARYDATGDWRAPPPLDVQAMAQITQALHGVLVHGGECAVLESIRGVLRKAEQDMRQARAKLEAEPARIERQRAKLAARQDTDPLAGVFDQMARQAAEQVQKIDASLKAIERAYVLLEEMYTPAGDDARQRGFTMFSGTTASTGTFS